ncbi:MAG: cytochrome c, partial [Isosphaeraceae bacterium]|nr:cytochrome c [Isosphaeraceae bacterium]
PLPEPAPLLDEGETFTFNKHVAPILWKHCASCHRPGEVGPFPLLTYRDAAKRADFLRAITASRRMPPWKPVHGYGDFLNERRLSRRELATLARWAETGSEEGDPADLAPLPQFPEGWQIGQPDLVLTMPEPFAVPAGSDDIYRAFVLPIPLDHDQTIATVEFRPGNRRIVHHVRMYLDPTDECRRRDAADPLPGFKTFGACDIRKPGVGAWLPGMVARRPPEGVGKIVKAHSDLVVLIHYHGSGKPETDQSSVGLYFLKGPLRRSFTNIPLSTAKIDIPPGAKRHRITQTAYLVADAHAYSVMPHGHFLMREISLTATRPDGTVVPMLWIKDWDINWQGQYHFAQPIALPRGTRLDVIALYDNSDENPRNPFHPPRRVRFGPASTDEMLGCHVQVLVDHPDDQKLFDQKWPYNL